MWFVEARASRVAATYGVARSSVTFHAIDARHIGVGFDKVESVLEAIVRFLDRVDGPPVDAGKASILGKDAGRASLAYNAEFALGEIVPDDFCIGMRSPCH